MNQMRLSSLASLLIFFCAAGVYLASVNWLQAAPPKMKPDRLQVVLPAVVQTLMAAGDTHLAANVGTFRAMTLTVQNLDDDTVNILAKVQVEAAILNPRHEDNYYIAQAILPWQGETDLTMVILNTAIDSRPWDYMPAFFLAFDTYYFQNDITRANEILLNIASPRTEETNRKAFKAIASKWYERGADPVQARAILQGMKSQTTDARLKHLLDGRISRLDGLITLQNAARTYKERTGKRLESLNQLVTIGLLQSIPADPFGKGYRLSSQGVPEVNYETAR